MSDNDPRTNHGAALLMIAELNRKLARFEQAELPEEPVVLGQYRSITRAHNFQDVTKDHYVAETCKEITNYIDAIRAHAAKLTGERDEAKERAEKAERELEALQAEVADWLCREPHAQIRVMRQRAEAAERRADESARDAQRYRARRMEVYKTRRRIEMPQSRNWKPTTLEDFNAEYDAECDKEIVKQRAARSEEGKDSVCNSRKMGEYNSLRCCSLKGHAGEHCYVVADD